MIKRRLKGFSLVELSVVLVLIGAMLLAIPAVTPLFKKAFLSTAELDSLKLAEQSLKGFLLANNRLPCPDSDNDGDENCAAGVASGLLPFRALGLSTPVKNQYGLDIAYAIYRNPNLALPSLDADLAAATLDRFSPLLPEGEVTGRVNGLDFCWALRTAASTVPTQLRSYVGPAGIPLNQAYILVNPGLANVDNTVPANLFFDGSNSVGSLGFELPSRVQDLTYDDTVKSVGFNELSGELNCPSLLAELNGAARAAFVAYDLERTAQFYDDFRVFTVRVANHDLLQAQFNVALAATGAAIYVAQTIIAIAIGAESFGTAVATIAIPAVAAGTLTAIGVVDAATGLASSIDDLAAAVVQKNEAATNLVNATALKTERLDSVRQLDAQGWIK